jgi:hypothetical protein
VGITDNSSTVSVRREREHTFPAYLSSLFPIAIATTFLIVATFYTTPILHFRSFSGNYGSRIYRLKVRKQGLLLKHIPAPFLILNDPALFRDTKIKWGTDY